MSGEAGWLRSHDVLAHEIYNNTRPAPGYAHYIATHLQYTPVHCSTLHYITVVQVLLQAREEGKVLVSFTDSRRRRVHFWVASNKQ